MSRFRERPVQRLLSAYGRLPSWLQFLLHPWLYPVGLLSYFPVLIPVLFLTGAAFLAYLKLYYVYEQLSWTKIWMVGTSPLYGPVILVYILMIFAVPPLFVIHIVERWWRGVPLRPFPLDVLGTYARVFRKDSPLWDSDLDREFWQNP